MDLDTLTGAGGTITVGGKLLTLRHLNAISMGKLEAFLKERRPRPMKRFLQQIEDLRPLKESDPEAYQRVFDRLLLQAHEEDKQGLSRNEGMGALDGVEAVAYTIWLMAQPNHKELTFEAVREAINDDDLPSLKKKIDFVNRAWMVEAGNDGNGEGPLSNGVPIPG